MESTAQKHEVILKPNDVAEELGVKVGSVMRLLRAGTLKGFKVGGKSWRTTKAALDEYTNTSIENGNGKGRKMSDVTKNRIRYHAKLKSKESTPKAIQMMTDRILKIKQDLAALNDSDKKVPVVAKYKSTISAKVANMEKMGAITEELGELADQAYPGIRDLVDEDPDALEEIFTQEAQGLPDENLGTLEAEAGQTDFLDKLPRP